MNLVVKFIIILAGGIGLGIALGTANIVRNPPEPTPIVEAYPAPGGYPAPEIGEAIAITVTPTMAPAPPPPVWGPTPTSPAMPTFEP